MLFVDEAAFFPDTLLRELLGPTASAMFLASPNGQRMIVASSPGMQRRGLFFELCHIQLDKWESHQFTIYDNPVVKDPEKRLLELREANAWTLTSPAYQREGLGLWVDDATHSVYELSDINLAYSLPEGPDSQWTTVMAIDFGSNDASTVTVGGWRDHDPNLYILATEGSSNLDIEEVAQMALPLIERWRPIGVFGDTGGGGAQHADYLRKRHSIPVQPVSKRPNYKAPAIDAFNADARRGNIKILRDSPAVEQMQALQWESVALARGVRAEHPSMPNDHADGCLYVHLHSRQYRAELLSPPPPPLNSDEHWKQWSDAGLKLAEQQAIEHHKALEDAEEERAYLTGGEWE